MKKTQLLQYLLTAIGLTGIVGVGLYYGTIDPKTEFPSPISVDGQVIEFTWTDDNSDENLHIFTDKATYTDGFSSATVYVAVANKSNKEQSIELQGFFRDENKNISDVEVLSQVEREIHTPEYKEVCVNEKKATSTQTCTQTQVGTTTTKETNNQWVSLGVVERTQAEILKEDLWKLKKTFEEKAVENFVAKTKSVGFPVGVGEVVYFKVEIEYPANSDDNFYFVAKGSEGGYGHLDPWFNASWLYRVKVEVNPTYVTGSANLTNYPVYVNLNNLPAGFHTNVKTDGCDIRVVESDETTETPFELVAYDSSTDTGELHFKADSLSYNATSTFYIYYGNSGASCYSTTDTYGRNNTWNSVYASVWHLNESSGTRTDAKGSNNLTDNATVTNTTGKVGATAAYFTKANSEYLNITDASQSGLDITGNMTITSWVNAATSHNGGIVQKWQHSVQNAYRFELTTSGIQFYVADAVGGFSYTGAIGSWTYSTATWYHLAVTYAASAGDAYIYRDADIASPLASNLSMKTSIANASSDFRLGGQTGSTAWWFNGAIDEVRIAASTLSTDWIKTEYNNQNSPSTFYWVGAQESNGVSSAPKQSDFWF